MSNFEDVLVQTRAKACGKEQWIGFCQSHNDQNNPSLSLSVRDGKILVHCFAGCTQQNVLLSLGLLNSKEDSVSYDSEKWRVSNDFNPVISDESESYVKKYFQHRGIPEFVLPSLRNIKPLHSNGELLLSFSLLDWVSGKETGTHSIYIDKDGKNLKQGGKNRKITRGKIENNFFVVGDRQSPVWHICEGIETALAVYSVTKQCTIPSIGASNLSKIKIPENVELHIWADNDENEVGQKAAVEVAKRQFLKNKVIVHIPEKIDTDWNDVLVTDPKSLEAEYLNNKAFGWEKPNPIQNEQTKLTKLNPNDLPSPIFNFIQDTHERTGAPFEFMLVSFLTSLSAQLSRSFVIQPKENDRSWEESPLLWGALIGRPGTKKSPAISLGGLRFVKKIDELNLEREKKAIAEYISKKEELESKKKLKGQGSLSCEERFEINLEDINLKPENFLLLLNDSTPQSIIRRVSYTNNTLLYVRDELTAVFADFKSETSATLRQLLLEGWNGLNGFRKETISRGVENVDRLSLGLMGGIQPNKLKPIIEEIILGKNDDGFIQRIQAMVYPEPKRERIIDREENFEATRIIESVYIGLNEYESKYPGLVTIHITKEGRINFEEFSRNLDDEINQEDCSDLIRSFLSKYHRLYLSLALIFHIFNDKDFLQKHTDISSESLIMASNMTNFFKSHLMKILQEFAEPLKEAKVVFADKILEKKITTGMTARDIKRKCWKGIDESNVESLIAFFEDNSWLLTTPREEKMGRKTNEIIINPFLFEMSRNELIKERL